MHVNFIMKTTGEFYKNVLNSMIDPILFYLKNYSISNDCIENAINIHFFNEQKYYYEKLNIKGINVFMSHGIADKNWRNYERVKFFDYVCVSGNLWYDKLCKQGMDKRKILITGYTKLDPIFKGKYGKQNNDKPKILYAPTHNLKGWSVSGNASSYPEFLKYLDELSKDFEIIESYHPANNEGQITFKPLIDADVVISDCSSIIYEAWALDKPVVFPDWLVKKEIQKVFRYSFEDYIYGKQLGYHASNTDELLELIKIAYENGIDKSAKVFIENIFPKELRGKSGLVTAQTLMRIQN